jgi:hypothetical protein
MFVFVVVWRFASLISWEFGGVCAETGAPFWILRSFGDDGPLPEGIVIV